MKKCKCSLKTELTGDGCDVCNPALSLDLARERVEELETELTEANAKIAALNQVLAQESRKAADFERLVMEGELVEHGMVSKWLTSGSRMSLKQFAKEKQKGNIK